MIAPFIGAAAIAAVLIAAALHTIGVRWCWAFLISAIIAAGLAWSAADAAGLL